MSSCPLCGMPLYEEEFCLHEPCPNYTPMVKKEVEIFKISDFFDQVTHGVFNEYDGSGYYGSVDQKSEDPVQFTDILWSLRRALNKGHTHVHWYNK